MLHGALRKCLRRKYLVLLTICVFAFNVWLHASLMKRSEARKEEFTDHPFGGNILKEDLPSRQRERRMTVERNCRNRSTGEILPAGSEKVGISRHAFANIIVNDKYRFLYCQVPKVATSNWKRVLMVLNGNASNPWKIRSADVHNRTHGYFRYLNEYTPSEIVDRLRTYYKFMFVRHPIERLVSAYRNKFVESYNLTFFARIYGRYIIRKFRNQTTGTQEPEVSVQNGTTHFRVPREPEVNIEQPDVNYRNMTIHVLNSRKPEVDFQNRATHFRDSTKPEVSFQEFIHYVINDSDDVMNNHWRLYDDLCRPCLVYYNFIGHFEKLAQDTHDILEILGLSDKVAFPMNISSQYRVPSSTLAQQYFLELSQKSKEKLYKKYHNDFEMFGYKMF